MGGKQGETKGIGMAKEEAYREMLDSLFSYVVKLLGENVAKGIAQRVLKPIADKRALKPEELPESIAKYLK